MEMKDRINEIMKYYKLGSSEFAKRLEMNASILSHIMSGRNKASLDVVLRILSAFEEIDPNWLLFNQSPMLKDGTKAPIDHEPKENTVNLPELIFEEPTAISEPIVKEKEIVKPVPITPQPKQVQKNDVKPVSIKESRVELEEIEPKSLLIKPKDKTISRITVFYNDKTYQTFVEEDE